MQLFDDEILSVVLKFTNPSRGEMVDAGKVASGLSLALDNVIRKSVSAGKALNDIYEGISKLGPELKSLEKRSGLIQGQVGALRSAQQILARYTPARLEKMAEVQASRIAESSGTAALRRQLEKHGATIQKLVDVTDDKKQRAAGHTPDSDLTREQRLLSIIRQEARELRHELTQKLAEADRLNWSRPFVSTRAQVSTPELRKLEQQHGDIYTRLAIAGITGGTTARARRPAHSTDYGVKLGSGQAEETTPGYLGPAAIALDRRIGVINEFLRHTKVALTTPALAQGILTNYLQQQQYQERIQASRGRSQQSKVEIRHGDELLLAAMAGVNTRTVNDATPGYHEAARSQRQLAAYMQKPARVQKMETIEKMLGQSWARPTRQFSVPEINAFVGKYRGKPATEAIQTAAQMASSVGLTGHKYFDLTNIMLAGQSVGRQAANTRAAMPFAPAWPSWELSSCPRGNLMLFF